MLQLDVVDEIIDDMGLIQAEFGEVTYEGDGSLNTSLLNTTFAEVRSRIASYPYFQRKVVDITTDSITLRLNDRINGFWTDFEVSFFEKMGVCMITAVEKASLCYHSGGVTITPNSDQACKLDKLIQGEELIGGI